MPIRFRCAYCNQLMGISRRKVGTIVRCPKCSGQVVVPQLDESPESPEPLGQGQDSLVTERPMTEPTGPKGLEDPELEMLLEGAAKEAAGVSKKKRKMPRALPEIDVEPLDFPLPPVPPQPGQTQPAPPMALFPPPPEVVAPRGHAFPAPPDPLLPAALPKGTVSLSRGVAIGLAVVVVLFVGLAFLVGYLLGKNAAG